MHFCYRKKRERSDFSGPKRNAKRWENGWGRFENMRNINNSLNDALLISQIAVKLLQLKHEMSHENLFPGFALRSISFDESWKPVLSPLRVQLHEIDRRNSINRFFKLPTSRVILEVPHKTCPTQRRTFYIDKTQFMFHHRLSSSFWKLNCHIDIFLKAHAAWALFNLLSCSWIWIIWWDFWARCFAVERNWQWNPEWNECSEKMMRNFGDRKGNMIWFACDWLNKWAMLF